MDQDHVSVAAPHEPNEDKIESSESVESQQVLNPPADDDTDYRSAPVDHEVLALPSLAQSITPLDPRVADSDEPVDEAERQCDNVLSHLGIPISNSEPVAPQDQQRIAHAEPPAEDLDVDIPVQQSLSIGDQSGIPLLQHDSAFNMGAKAAASTEDRSQSPGEELFDQVARETGEHALFENDTKDDWLGTSADNPSLVEDSEDVQHEIDGERISLVENTEEPQHTPFLLHDSTTGDTFFSERSTADAEADTDWMHSNIDDALQRITDGQAPTDQSIDAPQPSADTFFDDRDKTGVQAPADQSTAAFRPSTNTFFEDLDTSDALPPNSDVPADKIEDSWAQAFETGDLDEVSWDNAFASNLEYDGFLEDDVTDTDTSSQRYTPATSDTSRPPSLLSRAQQLTPFPASYAPALPQLSQPQSQERAKPMEFFAELPTANVRSRKPQRTTSVQTQPTPPPPASAPLGLGQSAGQRPPSSSSYQKFAGPGRLDLFPPQPSVPLPQAQANPPPSVPVVTELQEQPHASRYSPAPVQPRSQPTIVPPTQPVPPTSAVPITSTSPVQPRGRQPDNLGPPTTFSIGSAPRQRSPYAPAPSQSPRHHSPYSQPPSQSSRNIDPSKRSPSEQPTQNISPRESSTSRYPPAKLHAISTQSPADRAPPPSADFFEALPPPPAHRFAPRTSSPLAQPQRERPHANRTVTMPVFHQEPSAPADHGRHQSLGDESGQGTNLSSQRSAPPPASQRYSPISTASHSSQTQQSIPEQPEQYVPDMPPPSRPPISSPAQTRLSAPSERPSIERAASTHIPAPPTAAVIPSTRMARSSLSKGSELDFVVPQDETAEDPLERWKGCPVFRWGPGGSILTCSPKRIPRYDRTQSAPKLKCIPGEPRLQKVKDLLGDDDHIASFPGPLKSKSKKKDVLAWLTIMVDVMEQEQTGLDTLGHDSSREVERTLLWKCVKVFIENDGVLVGNSIVDAAIRQILIPSSDSHEAQDHQTQSTTSPIESQSPRQPIIQRMKQLLLRGEREKAVWLAVDNKLYSHAMLISSTLERDTWRKVVQEFVRKDVRSPDHPNHSLAALYEVFAGDSEDSVDQLVPVSARSGFQMVSTADRASQPQDAMAGLSKWRETVGLILSNRSAEDEKALLAMGDLLGKYRRIEAAHLCYLFARSVARFGGTDDPQTRMTLLGFDHSSPDTVLNLDSILLTEVYEFGLSVLATPAVLVSSPHLQAYKLRHAYALTELGQLTEALAYCDIIASSMTSKTRVSPYYNAALLSQLDDLQKRLSQSPKDATSGWMKTKPTIGKITSGMGNWFGKFVEGEDDAASNGSGYHSESEAGPFTRNLGGTPSISRSASTTDLFSADFARSQGVSMQIPAIPNSKYAPNAYGHRPSFEMDNAGPLSSYGSSPEQRYTRRSPRLSSDTSSMPYGSPPGTSSSQSRLQPSGLSRLQSYQPDPRQSFGQGSYLVDAQDATSITSYPSQNQTLSPPLEQKTNGYAPSASGHTTAFGEYQPSMADFAAPQEQDQMSSAISETASYGCDQPQQPYQSQSISYGPPSGTYELSYNPSAGYDPSGGYEPTSGGGYAPPSYDPSAGVASDSLEDAPEPRKKMFGDDDEDDDIAPGASALISSSKSANDRAADDAFRKAAEADAARDKPDKRSSSGWFKGITLNPFGGAKKDQNMPQVHKAKLGEANSFYYDDVAKRWVNKNAGAATPEASTPTPPPPRMGPPMGSAPPSRAVSGVGPLSGTPSTSSPSFGLQSTIPEATGPPSRIGSPGSVGSEDVPPPGTGMGLGLQAQGTPPSSIPAGLVPSSRPSTGMSSVSNASSLDDLMAAPSARKGGTLKKGKKGANRYVDVMAK